jgi:histidinol-phosphate aminotransferase
LAQQLSELGWACVASETNFLLSTPPSDSIGAEAIYTRLKAENILVRYFNHPRLDDKLRISIGTEEQNQVLLNHLRRLVR